jgi:GNAT superfamily N-acetyltransferase
MTVQLDHIHSTALPAWLAERELSYVEERVNAGDERVVAEQIAAESFARLFPNGAPAEGHCLFNVVADGEIRGLLWVGPHPDGAVESAWIWDIEIQEQYRGTGLGRATMAAAEDWARNAGYRTLALNVFGFNSAARGLYESLGFETVSVRMQKPL